MDYFSVTSEKPESGPRAAAVGAMAMPPARRPFRRPFRWLRRRRRASGPRSSLCEQDGGRCDGFLIFNRGAGRECVRAQRGGWRCFVRRFSQESAPVGRRGGLINDGVLAAAESDEVSCHAPSLGPRRKAAARGWRRRTRPRMATNRRAGQQAECFSAIGADASGNLLKRVTRRTTPARFSLDSRIGSR